MRIISGELKGRKLLDFKNLPIRPTSDRAKEGLFNILANKMSFNQLEILDLFSGTGNISYEFISRGVHKSICVDQSKDSIEYIYEMSRKLDIENHIYPKKSEVLSFLKKNNRNPSFDLIFADPPFDWEPENISLLLDAVLTEKWLKKKGLFIMEHAYNKELIESHPLFLNTRSYSKTKFSFFSQDLSSFLSS